MCKGRLRLQDRLAPTFAFPADFPREIIPLVDLSGELQEFGPQGEVDESCCGRQHWVGGQLVLVRELGWPCKSRLDVLLPDMSVDVLVEMPAVRSELVLVGLFLARIRAVGLLGGVRCIPSEVGLFHDFKEQSLHDFWSLVGLRRGSWMPTLEHEAAASLRKDFRHFLLDQSTVICCALPSGVVRERRHPVPE